MTLLGIDVSKWQGAIDWSRVDRAGVRFAIARATIGTVVDPYYARNATGMRGAGLIPGAYHFLYPASVVSPESQADRFLATIGSPEGMLTVLDVERDGAAQPSITDVARWVAQFRERYPRHAIVIYTGRWYWASSSYPIRNGNGARFGPLWLSHYVELRGSSLAAIFAGVPTTYWSPGFGGWTSATLLQFTSGASVPGVSGPCDGNAYRGTVDELRRLTVSVPAPAPTTAPQERDMSIYERRETTGRFVVESGTAPRGYRPKADGSGWEAAKTWVAKETDSPAPFDYHLVRVSGSASPSSLLHVSDGFFEGLFVSTADVTEEHSVPTAPAPTAPPPEPVDTAAIELAARRTEWDRVKAGSTLQLPERP